MKGTKLPTEIINILKTAPISPMMHELEEEIMRDEVAWTYIEKGCGLEELSYNINQARMKLAILEWVKEDLLSKVKVIDQEDFDLYKIMDKLFSNPAVFDD